MKKNIIIAVTVAALVAVIMGCDLFAFNLEGTTFSTQEENHGTTFTYTLDFETDSTGTSTVSAGGDSDSESFTYTFDSSELTGTITVDGEAVDFEIDDSKDPVELHILDEAGEVAMTFKQG